MAAVSGDLPYPHVVTLSTSPSRGQGCITYADTFPSIFFDALMAVAHHETYVWMWLLRAKIFENAIWKPMKIAVSELRLHIVAWML